MHKFKTVLYAVQNIQNQLLQY